MILQPDDTVDILVSKAEVGSTYLRVSGREILEKFQEKAETPKKASKKVRDGVFDGRGASHLHRALCNFGIHVSGKPVDLEKMAYNVWYDLDWHKDDEFSDKTIEHLKGIRRILMGDDPFIKEAITSATIGDLFNMISEILVVTQIESQEKTK